MSTAIIPSEQQRLQEKTSLGFWIYIMTDCVLFSVLFVTYVILQGNTFGGPSGKDIFNLDFVLAETLILLISSFTCGLALLAMRAAKKTHALVWLLVTFALGAMFLGLELYEFSSLVSEGYSWRVSGFLTAFFTLVGTHGLHITAGLTWLGVLGAQLWHRGFTPGVIRRLTLFGVFWHFLDVVWIFIFTVVYLKGVAG